MPQISDFKDSTENQQSAIGLSFSFHKRYYSCCGAGESAGSDHDYSVSAAVDG